MTVSAKCTLLTRATCAKSEALDMAFSVAQMYPGAFTADVNFVDGKYKNSSAPGVYDGTPLDNLLFNQNLALFDALMLEANLTYNNSADIPETSQLHRAIQIGREVSPRNNDWNGYLDPEHQSSLPAPNGYPGASGGGEVSYTEGDVISDKILAGTGGATVSSDSDGWIFTGSIYKLFDYTTEQLDDIVVTEVPVYLKNQVGAESFLKHNGTSVIVTKVGSQLKVEITDAIFAGSFIKLWRFFVTERVGRVVELSVEEVSNLYYLSKKRVKCVMAGTTGAIYSSEGILSVTRTAAGTYDVVTDFDTGTTNFSIVGTGSPSGVSTVERIGIVGLLSLPARTTNSFRMITAQNGDNGAGPATRDYEIVSFEVLY